MASRLIAYKEAVESTFRTKLPTEVNLFTHHGEFGEKEIKAYLVKAPCVILAPLGLPSMTVFGSNVVATMQYGAFVLTRSKPELPRGDAAMAISEVIAMFLPYEGFGLARRPSDVEAANLYSGTIDQMGMALWAVRWRQAIELAAKDDCTYDDLAAFLRLDATYQLDEEDDPDDWDAHQTVELEGPDA